MRIGRGMREFDEGSRWCLFFLLRYIRRLRGGGLEYAQEGITCARTRFFNRTYSDEVWVIGGAHTAQYVIAGTRKSTKALVIRLLVGFPSLFGHCKAVTVGTLQ
jgi:hypothetical protein